MPVGCMSDLGLLAGSGQAGQQLTLSISPGSPDHGEGKCAVRDADRGLWRVLPHPAHAGHHLRVCVEVGACPG